MEISTRNRRTRRARDITVNLISVTLTLLAACFLVPSALGLQRYVITGSSMDGSIDLGSVVFNEVVPVSELEVGDVITYSPPPDSGVDQMITHRIISIQGDTFRTKGDAVPQADPWKFELTGPVQARVKFTVPYAGHAFIALADRTTRMILIGGPAALITLVSFAQVIGVLRRRPVAVPAPDARHRSVPVGG